MNGSTEETLLSRVIGREDGPDDWVRLRAIGAADPGVWTRLADGLEDDATLRAAYGPDAVPAVTLPPAPRRPSLRRIAPLLGWCLAGCFAAAWLWPAAERHAARVEPHAAPVEQPDLAPVAAAAPEAIELPRIVLSTDVADDGSIEVTYVRRVVERTRVPELRAIHRDELGGQWSTAVPPQLFAAPASF